MKKCIAALGLSLLLGNAWASAPECPSVDAIKSTNMDFVLAFNSSDIPSFDPNFVYAAMGHLHGDNANWYVIDGAFMGETSTSEALKKGQEFLGHAADPMSYHDPSKSNVYACIYYLDQDGAEDGLPKVIIAANGSVDDLRQVYTKTIR